MLLLGKVLVSLLSIVWLSSGIANANYRSGSATSDFFSDGFGSESIVVAANKKPSWYKPKPSGTVSGSKKAPLKKPNQQGKEQQPNKQQSQQKRPLKQQRPLTTRVTGLVNPAPVRMQTKPMVSAASRLSRSTDKTGNQLARRATRQYLLKNMASVKGGANGSPRPKLLQQIKRKLRDTTSVVPAKGVVKSVQKSQGAVKSNQAKRKSDIAVLGRFPAYRNLSDSIRARRFNMPTGVYNKMSRADQWKANQKYLDRMIAKKDKVVLATPVGLARHGGGKSFVKELNYLKSKGYRLNKYGTRMLPPVE